MLLPALTSALGFGFCGVLLSRFAHRGQPYLGVWALGLLLYGLAAGSEAVGGAFGWTPGLYRTWYITGAIGAAAYLGAGSVYVQRSQSFGSLTVVTLLVGSIPGLAGRHLTIGLLGLTCATLLTIVLSWRPAYFGHAVFALLVATSLAAAMVVLNAPVDMGLLPSSPDEIVSGQAFDAETRALPPPFNIVGAMMLLLGAVMSAAHYRHTRSEPAALPPTS